MQTSLLGSTFAILSAITYATIPLFAKPLGFLGMETSSILFWRFLISFLFLLLLFPKKVITQNIFHSKEIFLSLVGFVISSFFYFESLNHIGPGLSMTVFFIYPMILALMNFFILGEHIPNVQKISMIFAFLSLFFLTGFDFSFQKCSAHGILYSLLGGCGYALYAFYGKFVQAHSVTLTAWMCFASAIFFGCQTVFLGEWTWIPNNGLLNMFGLTIFSTILAFVLFVEAMHRIGNVKASLLSAIEPGIAILIGIVFFQESFDYIQIGGLVMMACSIIFLESAYFIQYASNRK